MEPCNGRLSGNRSCTERILRLKGVLGAVYVGIYEPSPFIENNGGKARIEAQGIGFQVVNGLYARCAEVAMAGHEKTV